MRENHNAALSVVMLHFSGKGELGRGTVKRTCSGKRLLWEETQTLERLYLHLEILALKGELVGKEVKKKPEMSRVKL